MKSIFYIELNMLWDIWEGDLNSHIIYSKNRCSFLRYVFKIVYFSVIIDSYGLINIYNELNELARTPQVRLSLF